MKELQELKEKLIKSASNGEIRVFEGYASDTTVEFNFADSEGNLLGTFYKKIDFYVDALSPEVDENGVFTSNQQIHIVNNIFKFDLDYIKGKENFNNYMSSEAARKVKLVAIIIGDKMSDGSYEDLYIEWSVNID